MNTLKKHIRKGAALLGAALVGIQAVCTGFSAAAANTSAELIHNPRFEGYRQIECIDVSKSQGTIDWYSVAADGIERAYIHVGSRGYGAEGYFAEDRTFESNFRNAQSVGIEVGLYFFSQAITTDEAIAEAQYVLDKLAAMPGYRPDLPIYYDIEEAILEDESDVGRMDAAGMTRAQYTANAKAFCERIERAGYRAGIYSCKYWLENNLDMSQLETKYSVWLANHGTDQTSYFGAYEVWQYTKDGHVNGIVGEVDRSVAYVGGTFAAPVSPQGEELTAPLLSEVTYTLNDPDHPEAEMTPPALSEVTTRLNGDEPELTPPSLSEITTQLKEPAPELTPPSLSEITAQQGTELKPPSLSEIQNQQNDAEQELTPPSLHEITYGSQDPEELQAPRWHEIQFQH